MQIVKVFLLLSFCRFYFVVTSTLIIFVFMVELTSRELKLIKLVCNDKSNAEIAEKLQMSLRYTEKTKTKIYTKTKTKSNVGLLKWAVINGLYAIKKR